MTGTCATCGGPIRRGGGTAGTGTRRCLICRVASAGLPPPVDTLDTLDDPALNDRRPGQRWTTGLQRRPRDKRTTQ